MKPITKQNVNALNPCKEWTDVRINKFFAGRAVIPAQSLIGSAGTQGITEEEIYWVVTGLMTQRRRRLWCLRMLRRAVQAYPDAGALEMLNKMEGFLSRNPTNAERKTALIRARKLERDARIASKNNVTKRSRFRRMVVSLMSRSDMRDESLKIARMLLHEHPNFDYATLNQRLLKLLPK